MMNMASPAEGPFESGHRRKLVILGLLITALFMATLDNHIVSTALPTIVGELGEVERFGWIGSIFLLAMSATMPIYGKLGDMFGRKYVFLAAIFLFLVGSLACGLAWSMNALIGARALQGLGAGGLMVSIFAINADLFEPRERAKYQSYSSLVVLAAGSLGPLLGGYLSEHFGWRAIFLVNLPIGILVLTGLAALLPYRRPDRKPHIDYPGAALLAATMAGIVIWADSISLFGSLFAWQSWLIVGATVISAILWVLVERRAKEPIVPLSLFRNHTFSLLLAISFCIGAIAIGMVNYFALFLQTTTGLSPSKAGLLFIGTTGGIVIGSLVTGRRVAATGGYKPLLLIGLPLNLAVLVIFTLLPAGTPVSVIALLMFVHGLAIGFGQQVPIIGVQNVAAHRDVGAATGAVTLMRMGGGSIAISIYGAIVAAGLKDGIAIPGVQDIAALTPAMLSRLPDASRQMVATLYSSVFSDVFLTAALIAGVGLAAAFLLKPARLAEAT